MHFDFLAVLIAFCFEVTCEPSYGCARMRSMSATPPSWPDVEDSVLNGTAQILQLLCIEELRELQTKINEAAVTVQAVVADPKTETTDWGMLEEKHFRVSASHLSTIGNRVCTLWHVFGNEMSHFQGKNPRKLTVLEIYHECFFFNKFGKVRVGRIRGLWYGLRDYLATSF